MVRISRPINACSSERGTVCGAPGSGPQVAPIHSSVVSSIWTSAQPHRRSVRVLVCLPPDPSVAKVRAVARSFSSFSAVSPDGFHLNNYAQLSDDGVRCLIGILRIFEKVGRLPRRIRLLLTFLINKPKGGLRALGLFPSLYRLWARLRRGYMVDWEVKNQKPFFHLWEKRLGH